MRMKRFLALLICFVMVVSLSPVVANADTEKEYTVILLPGEGTGEPIVYSTNKDEITKGWKTAGNCEFYLDDDGSVGFCLNDDHCPESFTEPPHKTVVGWDGHPACLSPVKKGTNSYTAIWDTKLFDEYSICGIPRAGGDPYSFAGIGWILIGEDINENVGLLLSDPITDDGNKRFLGEWEDACRLCEEIYLSSFSEWEKSLVIPTSKSGVVYYVDGQECRSLELKESKLFILSIDEVDYYLEKDNYGTDIPWWTRTVQADSEDRYVGVTETSLERSTYYEKEQLTVRLAFQVDLNALGGVQALPPALPEGVFSTKTGVYKITDKAKREVQMIEGNVSAKGVLTVPKTVTYKKKKYKVTSIREMTFDGNSELKTIKITAGNLREVGDNAFRFINKKAVFKIKGTVKAFRKLRKVIKASAGLPKKVTFKRIKN
ncbi:MAG: hypothetical protein ILP10_04295 [Lachnospiraceae bacterium]|nr:hypothetical protein [Lachnospiraceae bacterium]